MAPLSVAISTPAAVTWTGTIGWTDDEDALGDFPAFGAGSVVTGPSATHQTTPLTEDKDVYIVTATASLVSGDSISTTIYYIQAG